MKIFPGFLKHCFIPITPLENAFINGGYTDIRMSIMTILPGFDPVLSPFY